MKRLVDHLAWMAVAATVLVSACDAPTASRPNTPPYSATSLTNGFVYRWPSGSTIGVYVDAVNSNEDQLFVATVRAINTWNNVTNFGEFRLERVARIEESNIVVYDRSRTNPVAPNSCDFDPRGAGYTYICFSDVRPGFADFLLSSSAVPTNATVAIAVLRSAVTSNDAYYAVVAHEFGHALGIGGHSDDPNDLMYGNPTFSTPSERDFNTLQWVLGQKPNGLLR